MTSNGFPVVAFAPVLIGIAVVLGALVRAVQSAPTPSPYMGPVTLFADRGNSRRFYGTFANEPEAEAFIENLRRDRPCFDDHVFHIWPHPPKI